MPSRLHASVLDMNRFGVGAPGGGGIGFAVSLYCRARAVLIPGREVQAGGTRPAVALHLAQLFRAVAGWDGGIDLELDDHGRRHMGLGSSIGTITAAAVALNEVLGRPFALRDLRKLVAFNYCEEAADDADRLVAGFETNVGAMAALHGGMVVASDACELIHRVPLPEGMRALLILPRMDPRVSSGEGEAHALLNEARTLDEHDGLRKAYRVLMDLLPAMVQGDLERVGEVLYDLARMGSKRAECRLHGDRGREIYETLERLRAEGAEVVSMSSVGPAVFALSARPEVWRRWERWKAPQAARCTVEVPVDNAGARVRLDGAPVPYRYEPWWWEPGYPASPEPETKTE
ncbi:MAG: hypothetical protein Kow0092_28300 [Deferrisomatales bacterium]